MTKDQAAELWAQIEASLAQRGMFIRDADRAELIRLVGRGQAPRKTRATSPLPAPVEPPVTARRPRARPVVEESRATTPFHPKGDTVHDPRLAALLERSCSRRTGYDGDDSVGYH